MKTMYALTALMSLALSAIAAEPAQPINIIFSADNATCTAWMKSAGNKLVRAQYEFWARGFASGYNYANPARQVAVGAFPGGEDLYRYFDQFCKDNPQQTFVGGAIQLIEQLHETTPGKPAPAKKQPAAKVPAPAK